MVLRLQSWVKNGVMDKKELSCAAPGSSKARQVIRQARDRLMRANSRHLANDVVEIRDSEVTGHIVHLQVPSWGPWGGSVKKAVEQAQLCLLH